MLELIKLYLVLAYARDFNINFLKVSMETGLCWHRMKPLERKSQRAPQSTPYNPLQPPIKYWNPNIAKTQPLNQEDYKHTPQPTCCG